VERPPLRLDIGCGKNKKAGFTGVDSLALDGVDVVADLRQPWPFDDNSVEEANCSHFLEHLTNFDGKWERVHFFNELHRVLKPGAACALVIPHWASNRYYGDPTHKEPFSEMGFYYLSKEWRATQAPHTDAAITGNPALYSCDFDATWGYSLHPTLLVRNLEYQQHAMTFWKEACQDLVATLKKKG
jgi:SAM-dependent methyltransferase